MSVLPFNRVRAQTGGPIIADTKFMFKSLRQSNRNLNDQSARYATASSGARLITHKRGSPPQGDTKHVGSAKNPKDTNRVPLQIVLIYENARSVSHGVGLH